MADSPRKTRRELIAEGVRTGGLIAVSGLLGSLATRAAGEEKVWQIDPYLCSNCGKCATECVLDVSAVKCVHAYAMCGYCKICSGLLADLRPGNGTGAEDQRCPTAAIRRAFVEDPYFEYVIDENLCVACAKCTKGCNLFGNGSLYLQIRHDRCVNCNQCAIATACPAQAVRRVPAREPYLLKHKR